MAETTDSWNLKKIGRLTALAAVLAVCILLAGLGLEQVPRLITKATRWRMALAFVIGFEISYVITLVVCLLETPTLVALLLKARKQGMRRPWAARGLLLCLSTLFVLAISEVVAATVRARYERSTAVPVGGLKESPRNDHTGELPNRAEVIALPEKFRNAPGDDEVSLAVLGESSAAGVPYNFWFSIGDVLTWKLGEAIPKKKFRLDLLAVSGDTLEGQHRKLANLKQRPDVLIIYCGHNEFSSRFSWGREPDHYLDGKIPTPWEQFVDRLERTSPLCSLMRVAADKCRIAIPPPRHGYRNLVDVPAYTPAEYKALLADFEHRLEAMVSYAERIGALPILIVPPGNDSGFEPNRSFLPPQTTRAERAAFARKFAAARARESSDPAESERQYRALLSQQPGFAEAHYRLARLLERAGSYDEAYQHDVAARDCDGLPMRCPTAFQDVYRALARRHASCILIDAQALFHKLAHRGLLNDDLFHDGMHPSLRGIIALSQAVLGALHARRAFGWPQPSPVPAIDPTLCAEHFGLGQYEWTKLCYWGIMFYDMMGSVRYDPTYRRAKEQAFGKAADLLTQGRSPKSLGLANIGTPEAVPLLPAPGSPSRDDKAVEGRRD